MKIETKYNIGDIVYAVKPTNVRFDLQTKWVIRKYKIDHIRIRAKLTSVFIEYKPVRITKVDDWIEEIRTYLTHAEAQAELDRR